MDLEDDGVLRENRSPNVNLERPEVGGRRRSALRLGKLNPEQTRYEVRASATEAGSRERSEHGSDDSQQMIIKKGVEWKVMYDKRTARERGNSVAGTEGSTGAIQGADETIVASSYV